MTLPQKGEVWALPPQRAPGRPDWELWRVLSVNSRNIVMFDRISGPPIAALYLTPSKFKAFTKRAVRVDDKKRGS